MSLVMAVVSPHAAYMLSDGYAIKNSAVVSRDFRKIFTLPSGDKIIATGNTHVLKLMEELQAAEPVPTIQTIERIKKWMNEEYVWRGVPKPEANYHIGLIGRHEGLLRAW